MIVTFTANPSLDRTVALADGLRPGEVQPALSQREDAGGKGVNVARVIAAAGTGALAVLPLADDDPFATPLRAAGVPTHAVPVAGAARANLAITDPRGVTTKLNLPGATLTDAEGEALMSAIAEVSADARWLVLAGSLPPGLGDAFYVRVISRVRESLGDRAPRIAVDTSGTPLSAVVAEARPDLIKPNAEELADLVGGDLDDDAPIAEIVDVARALVPAQVGTALITLGAAGAVLVNADGAWHARPPRISVASTVGAGDSSLAGYLLGESRGAASALELSVRYGAAAASMPGTQPPTPADLPDGDISVIQA
ncbi:1-phosphofructokinase family hexose kinase [Microbacterium koreense]|uniref:1-phosphofructokinase family hexose kinase n=1 Tax=Microbacterium koreense TaxID=323761 RepID=A0ABW2ZSS6_9MICO